MRALKQPAIIGYILTGILVGPVVFGFVEVSDTFTTLSHIGVSFLLFIVGLHLDPRNIREVGKASVVTGLGQIIFTALGGFLISLLLGFDVNTAFWLGAALTFSSTIIIMKLVSDKNDQNTLYGKISIGLLIVQDIVALLLLMFVSTYAAGQGTVLEIITFTVFELGILLTLLYLATQYFLPWVTDKAASDQETLLFFAIAWCLVIAATFVLLGFSSEIGALLAGVTLSVSPYRHEISGKMTILRDFFILLFFVNLGADMTFSQISGNLLPLLSLSAFVLIGNPLIIIFLMSWLGYTSKTSFYVGIAIAQISEFSLIFLSVATQNGIVGEELLSIVTLIGVVTIAGSCYFVKYADPLYKFFKPALKKLERTEQHASVAISSVRQPKYYLFGYNRTGYEILRTLKEKADSYLVVDYNPEVIHDLESRDVPVVYGDASDPELLGELDFSQADLVISTLPDQETNMILLRHIAHQNPKTHVMCLSSQPKDAIELYEAGASYVITPHYLGGKHASMLIEEFDASEDYFDQHRSSHVEHLHGA